MMTAQPCGSPDTSQRSGPVNDELLGAMVDAGMSCPQTPATSLFFTHTSEFPLPDLPFLGMQQAEEPGC